MPDLVDGDDAEGAGHEHANVAAELELGYLDADPQAHRKKMGRWPGEAYYGGICSYSFWLELELGIISCSPCDHCHAWLQKHTNNPRGIIDFVCGCHASGGSGKAEALYNEWSDLMQNAEAQPWDRFRQRVEVLSQEEQSQWMAEAATSVLENAANFDMRILRDTTTFPLLMCWLVYAPPSERCEGRMACAADLLSLPASQLATQFSDVALKFRICFASALRAIARDGTMDNEMHTFVMLLVKQWSLSTQCVEGVNNSLKHMVGLAPHLSWQMLVARITSKMSLRLGHLEN